MRRSLTGAHSWAVLVALIALASCRDEAAPLPSGKAAAGATATASPNAPGHTSRASPAASSKATATWGPPTTDGAIAVGNLESQVRGAELLLSRRPSDVDFLARLVGLLLDRGSFLGRVADLERAADLGEGAVGASSNDPHTQARAFLIRARTRAALHRFQDALGDIEKAKELGVEEGAINAARAGILEGLGKYDEALALRSRLREQAPSITTLSAEAALLGEMGRLSEAEELFDEAVKRYPDVSPFPVAWIEHQRGLMWERADDLSRARVWLDRAHARLPAFAHAAVHLAMLEPPARAVALLKPIAQTSDDPEVMSQLARMLALAGEPGAEELTASARARYEALMKAHPLAFADHAGWFWLGQGKDVARAFDVAKLNLDTRQTPAAFELYLSAALEAKKLDAACEASERAMKLPYGTVGLYEAAARAFAACGRPDRAKEAKERGSGKFQKAY